MTDTLYNILMKPERIQLLINRKQNEITEIESKMYPAGIRYDRDKVEASPRDDQIPEVLAKTEPLKNDLIKLNEAYQEAMWKRSKLLDRIDPGTADIIMARIPGHKHWEELEEQFHYSRRQLGRLYSRGIRKLENELEKENGHEYDDILEHFHLSN